MKYVLSFLALVVLGVWGVVAFIIVTDSKKAPAVQTASQSVPTPKQEPVIANAPQTEAPNKENTQAAPQQQSAPPAAAVKPAYIYAIDDAKIKEAIALGKSCLLECGKPFMLPVTYSPPKKSEYESPLVYEANIEPPYEMVASASGLSYYKEDKLIDAATAKKYIDYNKLGFHVNFYKGFAKGFAVVLVQGNKMIEPTDVSVDEYYSRYKLANFPVSEIDFTKPAVLKVFDKSNTSYYVEFAVDFNKYVR